MFIRRSKLLFGLVFTQWKHYLLSIISVAIAVGISVITPSVMAVLIDSVLGSQPFDLPGWLVRIIEAMGGRDFMLRNIWIMALSLLTLNLAGGALQYVRGRQSAIASETISKKLRDDLYSHIQTLSYDYHVKAMTGDLIQRCISDVETIRRFLSSQLVEIFRTIFLVAFALFFMLQTNRQMTGISMMLVPPLFVFAFLFFRWVQKLFLASDEAEGRMSAVLQENLSGVRVVRAFARQQFEVEKFEKVSVELHKKSIKLADLLAVYWSSADMLSMLQVGITLVYGVYMAANGQISVGNLTRFVAYTTMLLWPVRQLGRILADFGRALVSMGRLDEILCQPSETDAPDATQPPIDQDIEFRDVGFWYDGQKPVLKHMNFKVKRGQTVAILGATGSGKSTMMLLMQRLYDVCEGEILIGGVNINRIEKSYLRSRIGLILQEPFLYSRSVKNNIGIARDDLETSELEEAAAIACAHDFIQDFDRGYDTIVGERGVTLSGGQMQRIAIARTLLKQNDILIFDDSLSAVDTETDQLIREQLRRKNAGLTTFIISHRLTTLMNADLILVLKDGAVAQQGAHHQLIEQEGLYKRIYNIQSALEEELEADAS